MSAIIIAHQILLYICHFFKQNFFLHQPRLKNKSRRQVDIMLSAAAPNTAHRLVKCLRWQMKSESHTQKEADNPSGTYLGDKMTTVNKTVIKSSSLFVSLVAGSGLLSPRVRMIYAKSYKATFPAIHSGWEEVFVSRYISRCASSQINSFWGSMISVCLLWATWCHKLSLNFTRKCIDDLAPFCCGDMQQRHNHHHLPHYHDPLWWLQKNELLSLLAMSITMKVVQSLAFIIYVLGPTSLPVPSPSTVTACWWARSVRGVSEINVFVGTSVCPICVICVCATAFQRGLLFLLNALRLDSSQGVLQGRWQMASVGRVSVPRAVHRLLSSRAACSHGEGF